jgi:antirestriction protein ArdC
MEAFESEELYWSVALHELTHWTGHESRCARDLAGRFGDERYAAEELVAEMGSALLCAHVGIDTRLRHPEYIGHWLRVLKADKYAVFAASKLAECAMSYLVDLDSVVPPEGNCQEDSSAHET